jgi:hypothetical protein
VRKEDHRLIRSATKLSGITYREEQPVRNQPRPMRLLWIVFLKGSGSRPRMVSGPLKRLFEFDPALLSTGRFERCDVGPR